jgi:uncharacterized protein YndB with AHSA1/START domain
MAPEHVFEYLADFSKHGEWVAGEIISQEPTSAGPIGQGTVLRTREAMKPGSKMVATTICEITTLTAPRLIEWRARTAATGGPMAMRSKWAFEIEPDGVVSRVTQRVTFDPPNRSSRALAAVFVPVVDTLFGGAGASPKNVRKHLEQLQAILDQRAASATSGSATSR